VVEEFSGKVQTAYGGAGLWRRFVQKLHLPQRLAEVKTSWSGRRYAGGEYLQSLLLGLLVGRQRQSEIADLRDDPGALRALGVDQVPSQSALSRFLREGTKWVGRQLFAVNRDLVRKLRAGRRRATIDLDGQVVSTRGNPEGANFGFNRKRRGAKSYHVLMSFWGEFRDILHAALQPGSQATVSARRAIQAYREARRALPASVKRVCLRADAGFYREVFLARLERDKVTYAIAAPLCGALKAVVTGLAYEAVDDKWALAELTYRGATGGQARRVVVVRERLEPENPQTKQLTLFQCDGYAYQLIVTTATWHAACVWRFYNGRSRLENIIKESQYDFGSDHVLSHARRGNLTWLALSVLAYNVTNWFREKVLGQRVHRHTARWLRRTLIEIPARLLRRGREYVLQMWSAHPSRTWFERAVVAVEAWHL
jgi:hypothetical protein